MWPRYNYLKNWNLRVKKSYIEKIVFTVVQIKFLAMHITNKKNIYMVGNLQNILMKHDLYLIS